MDDGDGRVGQIVRIGPRAALSARPRLAWKPWLRGFVIGALSGATLVLAYFWWRASVIGESLPSHGPWGYERTMNHGDD